MTCCRRLREWTDAGLWPKLHQFLLAEMDRNWLLNLDDMSVDGSHVRALKGGDHVGPSRSTAAALARSITCSSTAMACRCESR